MTNRNMILVTLATFFICASSFAAVERQELLPPGYAVTVRVSDTSKFIEQFKKSSLSRLWCDPQMKEVFGKKGFIESMKDQMVHGEDGEELAHLEWQEMMMLKGEMVLAFRSKFTEEPLIIAYMAKEDYMRSLDMDKRISELKKNGVLTIKKGTFQGVPFIQMITEETVNGKKVKKISWQAHIGNTFVASESKEFVEKTVVVIRKQGIKEPKGLPVMNVKVRLDNLIDQMEQNTPPPPPPNPNAGPSIMPPPPRPRKVFNALGLDAIDNIAIDITLKDDEMVIGTHVIGNDLTKGLFKMMDSRPSSLDLVVPFIPVDAYSYEVSRVDLRGLWLEIPKMVNSVDPMYGVSFQFLMAQMMGTLGLDIDAELLAHLDTQYLSFSTSAEEEPVGVTCLRLNDEDAVKAALGKMFSDTSAIRKGPAGASIKVEEFRGSPLYIFPPQPNQAAFMTPPPPAPVKAPAEGLSTAITVGGGYIMYGGEPGIRMVLRSLDASEGSSTSFYSSRLVKEMRRLAPKNCLGYGMIDWSIFITTFLSDSKGTTPLDALKMMAGSGGMMPAGANSNDIFGNADYSKLPSAEHMSKFFGPSFSYSTKDSAGLHGKLIMRYRPLGQK